MSGRQPSPYDSVARKWRVLAERRRAHVIELRESGRWKHYYTAEELLDALRDAVTMRDAWAKLAGVAKVDAPPAETPVAENEFNAMLFPEAGYFGPAATHTALPTSSAMSSALDDLGYLPGTGRMQQRG
jgi:uncharacterized repeat protein (TIGR03809 family)